MYIHRYIFGLSKSALNLYECTQVAPGQGLTPHHSPIWGGGGVVAKVIFCFVGVGYLSESILFW